MEYKCRNRIKRIRSYKKDKSRRRAVLLSRLDLFYRGKSKLKTYRSPKVCASEHKDVNGYCIRSSSDGKCVECVRLRSSKKESVNIKKSINESRIRKDKIIKRNRLLSAKINRDRSFRLGLKTYKSPNKCKSCNLCSTKYTSNGTCVRCSRNISSSDKKKDYDKEYYYFNKEKISKRTKIYFIKNKEAIYEANANWKNANEDKVRAIKHNYKQRRKGWLEDGVSTKRMIEFVEYSEKVCFYCNVDCRDDYQIDHIEPLSKGGEHKIYNLCIACKKCNNRKSSRDPVEFLDMVLNGEIDHIDPTNL